MLRWRLILGVLLVAALVGLGWMDAHAATPGVWLLPVVIVVTILATQETLDLLAAAGLRPVGWIVYLVNLFMVLSPWMIRLQQPPNRGVVLAIATSFVVPVLILFLAEMWRYRKPGGNIVNLAGGIFAWAYVGLMLQTAVMLRMSAGIGALAAWIIVVKMGDTGAYTVGRLVGRHKMAPTLSPGKTIEGAIGALAFSCLGSWFAFQWLMPWTMPLESVAQAPWWGWLGFGLLVGAAGMVGDLAESFLKRDVGVKDSSRWLPGFGGVLDIVDSLLLSAPVAWFCWMAGWIAIST